MDWNNDGYKDLIVGEYGSKTGDSTGNVKLYEGTSNGVLKVVQKLKCKGNNIVNRYVAPFVVDWNNDGLLDLIVGSNSKVAELYINSGTKEQYLFNEIDTLRTVNDSIVGSSYGRLHVKMFDIDYDGDKDVITGGWFGEVTDSLGEHFYFYENIGTEMEPMLKDRVPLKYVDGTDVVTRKKHCNGRFDMWDYNNDGYLDFIFADYRESYENPVKICLAEPNETSVLSYKSLITYNIGDSEICNMTIRNISGRVLKNFRNIRYSKIKSLIKGIKNSDVLFVTINSVSGKFEKRKMIPNL